MLYVKSEGWRSMSVMLSAAKHFLRQTIESAWSFKIRWSGFCRCSDK